VLFDYYQWCANGCGLYCYDLDAKVWVKLAGATPVADAADRSNAILRLSPCESAVVIATDRAGYILTIDNAGAKLINYSRRHAIGTALLPFVQDGRQDLIEDLRHAGNDESPARSVVIAPRDRKPKAALVSLRVDGDHIRWTIRVEPAQ
jgi:PAS domain-containing protein